MRGMKLGLVAIAFGSIATAQPAPVNLADFALRYVAAQEAVMEKGAGEREVQSLMNFYSADYTYYHPEFGAKVSGIDTVRRGLTSHLGETADATIETKGVLVNGSMVSLAVRESFVDVATGKRIERDRMTILTIRDGKVVQRIDA